MATSNDEYVPLMATRPLEVVKDEIKARVISRIKFAARLDIKTVALNCMFTTSWR